MAFQRPYLIQFFAVKEIRDMNTKKLRRKLIIRKVVKDFDYSNEAWKWAKKSLDTYLPDSKEYLHRFYDVCDYTDLATTNIDTSVVGKSVIDDITNNLLSVLHKFLAKTYPEQREFMLRLLGQNLSSTSDPELLKQVKFLLDMFRSPRESESLVWSFNKKYNRDLVLTQMENFTLAFLKKRIGTSSSDENNADAAEKAIGSETAETSA